MSESLSDNHGQTILMFFQMSFLNPRLADQGSRKVFKILEKQKEKLNQAGKTYEFESCFVQASHQVYQKMRQEIIASSGSMSSAGVVQELAAIELSPWRDFVRSTATDEILVLIWCHILKIPLPNISKALGVSEGTLNHRLSRAMKKLGSKLDSLSPKVRA